MLLSDTHELHRDVEIPPADLLIHAGDWTFFSKSIAAIEDFNSWLSEQRIRLGCVLSPGNHEFYLETNPDRRSMTNEATVLIGERLTVHGLNLWASPVTPLYGGAFGLSRPEDRRRHYAMIPEDTHVLITHAPPFGILECLPGSSDHQGCPELLSAVTRIKPRLHVFGHVRGAYGIHVTSETTFVNAALLGPQGDIAHEPFVFDISDLAVSQ